ncbi:hypothetical protein Tco_0493172 [Tanacetum coccineum]
MKQPIATWVDRFSRIDSRGRCVGERVFQHSDLNVNKYTDQGPSLDPGYDILIMSLDCHALLDCHVAAVDCLLPALLHPESPFLPDQLS